MLNRVARPIGMGLSGIAGFFLGVFGGWIVAFLLLAAVTLVLHLFALAGFHIAQQTLDEIVEQTVLIMNSGGAVGSLVGIDLATRWARHRPPVEVNPA